MTDFKLYLKSPTVLVGAFTVKELPFDEVINGCNAVFNSYVKVYSPIPSDPVNNTPGAVLFLQTAVDPEILASGIGFTIKSAELEYKVKLRGTLNACPTEYIVTLIEKALPVVNFDARPKEGCRNYRNNS